RPAIGYSSTREKLPGAGDSGGMRFVGCGLEERNCEPAGEGCTGAGSLTWGGNSKEELWAQTSGTRPAGASRLAAISIHARVWVEDVRRSLATCCTTLRTMAYSLPDLPKAPTLPTKLVKDSPHGPCSARTWSRACDSSIGYSEEWTSA